jgi:nitroreductase
MNPRKAYSRLEVSQPGGKTIMNKSVLRLAQLALAVLLICPASSLARELKAIQLPPPQMDGGRPLMQVLKNRASSRNFSPGKLPVQVMSNMLWAAFGVNRPESGGRTAPSASNSQEMDIYVATSDGLFLYDAKANLLKPVLAEDIRALTGRQPFVKEAPATLIYVSDLAKMTRAAPADREFYAAAHTGFIGQNVYLFCASEGLATVVRASMDRPALAKAMGLRPDQKITLAQTVGYPKK